MAVTFLVINMAGDISFHKLITRGAKSKVRTQSSTKQGDASNAVTKAHTGC